MKIEIFDPAMCCSTGVCGPSVDPELVRFQEALRLVRSQAPAVQVQRYGLSSDAQAFVANPAVAEMLKVDGPGCLPLVFVDGELACKGGYPGNPQLESIVKRAGFEVTLGGKPKAAGCCGPRCC